MIARGCALVFRRLVVTDRLEGESLDMRTTIFHRALREVAVAARVLLAVSFLWPLWAFGQHTAFESAIARFEARLSNDVARDRIRGISAGVLVRGKVIWKKGFGWADVKNQIPANGESIYRIGSISKSFTAVAMMQLVRNRGSTNLGQAARGLLRALLAARKMEASEPWKKDK